MLRGYASWVCDRRRTHVNHAEQKIIHVCKVYRDSIEGMSSKIVAMNVNQRWCSFVRHVGLQSVAVRAYAEKTSRAECMGPLFYLLLWMSA